MPGTSGAGTGLRAPWTMRTRAGLRSVGFGVGGRRGWFFGWGNGGARDGSC